MGVPHITTLRARLFIYFAVIIVIMAGLSVGTIAHLRSSYDRLARIQVTLMNLRTVSDNVHNLTVHTGDFIHTNKTQYLAGYPGTYVSTLSLVTALFDTEPSDYRYQYQDLRNMVLTFDEERTALLTEFAHGSELIYVNQDFNALSRLDGYIREKVDSLVGHSIDALEQYSSSMAASIAFGKLLGYLVIGGSVILCLLFALQFTRRISMPIRALSVRLTRFASGDLDVPLVQSGTHDEVAVLSSSFNNMSHEIKRMINEIKRRAELESQLHRKELELLQSEKELKDSELGFLQAQIHPHFLFNAMNTLAALAELEDAPRTRHMVGALSQLLRYSLRNNKEGATVADELESVQSYLEVQKARYGSKLRYLIEADAQTSQIRIPQMIIQPFVENAVSHGIEPLDRPGTVAVRAHATKSATVIVIEDDGIGFSPEEYRAQEPLPSGTGYGWLSRHLGIANVRRRLELVCHTDALSIVSRPGKGTVVTINLPRNGCIPEKNGLSIDGTEDPTRFTP